MFRKNNSHNIFVVIYIYIAEKNEEEFTLKYKCFCNKVNKRVLKIICVEI